MNTLFDTVGECRHLSDKEVMSIKLADHVIVCDGGYYSFSDEGVI